MPSHNLNLADEKTGHATALRVILALAEEAGGEIRFKARTYDAMDRNKLLVLDVDHEKGEIVIQSTTDFGSVVRVVPEATQWSLPANLAPTERTRLAAEAAAERRNLPSDEELADLEERLNRTAKVAREVADGKSPMRIRVQQ